jgi:hypothetical protein
MRLAVRMGAAIVVCTKCGAKNRIPEFTAERSPVCGNCKNELHEPSFSFWYRKASPWMGVVAATGVFVAIPLIIKATESTRPQSAVVANAVQEKTTEQPPLPAPHTDSLHSPKLRENAVAAKAAPEKAPKPTMRPVLRPDGPLSRFPDVNPELTVLTPDDDQRYFIMLVPIGRKSKSLKYLASGRNSFTVHVPSGRYKFMYASGPVWYGEADLFGEETLCSDGKDTIEFIDDGDKYSTNTITLHKIKNGNFDTLPISVEQFRRFM